jgi:acetolactate synthase-1/2/3 large subunit
VAADGARAVAAALAPPGQIATLILPADTAWNPAEGPASPLPRPKPAPVSDAAVDRAAQALRSSTRAALLMRGDCLLSEGLEAAGRVAAATGVRLMGDTFAPRQSRGAGRVVVERIPYFAEQMVEFLQDLEVIVLVGAKPPVAFFAYPDKPSWGLPAGCRIVHLAWPHEDATVALQAMAEALGAPQTPAHVAPHALPAMPSGRFNHYSVGQIIARRLPHGAIISDEGATSSGGTSQATLTAAPHDYLSLTGGSIGLGIPMATGAAVACPDRKVVCIQGDGGAMYTIQALWTQARETLDVTTVIFANHSYAILNVELARVGALNPGPVALSMLDLHNPELDFVKLAAGMGVEASRARTLEDFDAQFASAMDQTGPRLIEVVL